MRSLVRVIKFKRRKPKKNIKSQLTDREKIKWLLDNGLDLKPIYKVNADHAKSNCMVQT